MKDARAISDWYRKVTSLEVVSERKDIGAVALGSKERGHAIILFPGESVGHPEKLQLHFLVAGVDAEYDRLRDRGIHFDEPPQNKPLGWRHAYTRDPAGNKYGRTLDADSECQVHQLLRTNDCGVLV